MALDPALADEQYCYLTTTGRVSGKPREIEIWFGLVEPGWDGEEAGVLGTLYMLSGGRDHSDWVRNLIAEPRVSVRISDQALDGTARIVEDPEEDAAARRLLLEKYKPGYSGDLGEWGETALPVAVDLAQPAS